MLFQNTLPTQATNSKPVFPTLVNIDPRLPPKEYVFGFNVGDDYVAVTEDFVRDGPDGVGNMTVGGEYVAALYDNDSGSLGIWHRPSAKPIKQVVDVHGCVCGKGKPLEHVSTVENGAF